MFAGRKLAIATKHEKERVIAPIMQEGIGVICIVPSMLDTDNLGTFTGEIERTLLPIETARMKCRMAMEQTGCDIALASEGSFGPHPEIVFAPADDEILVFMDDRYGLEVVARELSTQTNFAGSAVRNLTELNEFATKVKFPSHAIILRDSLQGSKEIVKGISDHASLYEAFQRLQHRYSSVYAETDMRAMHNPSRMAVIASATKKLVEKLKCCCPECNMPGFSATKAIRGLPCRICSYPTRGILALQYACQKCGCVKEDKYPNNQTTQDPMYCDMCNP